MSKFKNQNLIKDMDFEAKYNLLGFFDLLLKIDIRNNPQNYKKESYENNRDTNYTDQS